MIIKCASRLLLALNLIFMIVAIVLLAIGVKFYTGYLDYEIFLETKYFSPAGIVISIGVILLVVSVFGFLAAKLKSVCIINIYVFTLTILLILELGGAITALIISNKAFENIKEKMWISVGQYNENDDFKRTWDLIHQDLKCCGVLEPYDWASVHVNEVEVKYGTAFTVPRSCCLDPVKCPGNLIYKDGCWNFLKLELAYGIKVMGYGVLHIVFLQLVGVIFCIILGKGLRRSKSLEEMNRQRNQSIALAQQMQNTTTASTGRITPRASWRASKTYSSSTA